MREAREVERAQNEQLRVLSVRLVQVGTRDPFSPYVAPRFAHMSEMNSSFMGARETPFSPYVAPRFAHMSEMDSSL